VARTAGGNWLIADVDDWQCLRQEYSGPPNIGVFCSADTVNGGAELVLQSLWNIKPAQLGVQQMRQTAITARMGHTGRKQQTVQLTSGQSNLAVVASNACHRRGSGPPSDTMCLVFNVSWVPKSLQPKLNPDPVSRFTLTNTHTHTTRCGIIAVVVC